MTSSTASSGSLFVSAAPSGAGKSSLVNALLQREPTVKLSISCTTRAPRPGEQHGREYFFLSEADFLKRQQEGEFLESASVHGNYYGTSRMMVSEQVIARRVQAASSEIAHAPEFEYVIINTEFELALNQLIAIVQASRCRFSQQAERNRSLFANFGIHVKQN